MDTVVYTEMATSEDIMKHICENSVYHDHDIINIKYFIKQILSCIA